MRPKLDEQLESVIPYGLWRPRLVKMRDSLVLYDVYHNGSDKAILRMPRPIDVEVFNNEDKFAVLSEIKTAFFEPVLNDEDLNKEAPF